MEKQALPLSGSGNVATVTEKLAPWVDGIERILRQGDTRVTLDKPSVFMSSIENKDPETASTVYAKAVKLAHERVKNANDPAKYQYGVTTTADGRWRCYVSRLKDRKSIKLR